MVQGCIFRLTCSHPELTEDHVLTSAYVKMFRTDTRNAVNKIVWRKKDCFWLPLNKHTMNIFIQISNSPRTRARFSENQSAPRLENRKTSPCSPCALNLLHVLVSRIPGSHNLCSPVRCLDFWQEHRIKNSGSVDDIDDADSTWASIISFDFCCQKIDIGTISIFQ